MEMIETFSDLCVGQDVPLPQPDEETMAVLCRFGDELLPEYPRPVRAQAMLRLYQYYRLRVVESRPFPENAKIERYDFEPRLDHCTGGYWTSCYDGGCCDEDFVHTYIRFERTPQSWELLQRSAQELAVDDPTRYEALSSFWSFRGALPEDCPVALTRYSLYLKDPFGLLGVYCLSQVSI